MIGRGVMSAAFTLMDFYQIIRPSSLLMKNLLISVSELMTGGELFGRIKTFTYQLVQLYVAEIAIALGEFPPNDSHELVTHPTHLPLQISSTTPE